MRAYGSVAAPIGHTTHVPLPTQPVGDRGDTFTQLDRAHARVSPILQAPALDPDAVARLTRLGILVEQPQLEPHQPRVLTRTRKRGKPAPKARKPRTRAHNKPMAAHQNRASRIDVPALIAAYQAGTTLGDITTQFACSRNTARRHLLLAGLELRDERRGGPRTPRPDSPTAIRKRRILELHEQGVAVPDIADRLDCTPATVRRNLTAHGITVPREAPDYQPSPELLELRQQIATEYRDGATVADLAERHGLVTSSIRKHLHRAGIPIRGDRRGPKPTFDVDQAIAQARDGWTVTRIAAEHGVTFRAVSAQLHRRGIPTVDGRQIESQRRGEHIDTRRIVELYAAGHTTAEVADHLGIAIATVRRRLVASGTPMRDDRSTNSGGQNHLPADAQQLVIDLYRQGLTGREVAARLGIGQTTVGRVLRAHDITPRTSRQAQTGRPGRDNARGLKDLMASNGVTTAQVRAWARDTSRPIPDRGLPPRHLVEAYLLLHRIPA